MAYEDIKNMFKDILEFEEQAMKLYTQVSQKTQNALIQKKMAELIRDEARHAMNAKEVLKMLGNS